MSATKAHIQLMLASVKKEIDLVSLQARKRVETLEARARTLEEWLAEESPQTELPISGGETVTLGTFLRTILSDGRPRPLAELTQMVVHRGGMLTEGAKSPGRNVHFALVGLQQHGYVKRNEQNKTWEVTRQ